MRQLVTELHNSFTAKSVYVFQKDPHYISHHTLNMLLLYLRELKRSNLSQITLCSNKKQPPNSWCKTSSNVNPFSKLFYRYREYTGPRHEHVDSCASHSQRNTLCTKYVITEWRYLVVTHEKQHSSISVILQCDNQN